MIVREVSETEIGLMVILSMVVDEIEVIVKLRNSQNGVNNGLDSGGGGEEWW